MSSYRILNAGLCGELEETAPRLHRIQWENQNMSK